MVSFGAKSANRENLWPSTVSGMLKAHQTTKKWTRPRESGPKYQERYHDRIGQLGRSLPTNYPNRPYPLDR